MAIIIFDLILFLAAFFLEGGRKAATNIQEAGKTLSCLGFTKIKNAYSKDTIFGAAVLLIILLALSLALHTVLGIAGLNDTEKLAQPIEAMKSDIPLLFYMLTVRVIAEEAFFRGFLARKLGIWLSSLIFALAHIGYGSIAEVIGAFALGAMLSAFFLRKKGIYANIYAHSAYNLVALFI